METDRAPGGSDRLLLGWSLVSSAAIVLLLAALLPETTAGGDADYYTQVAHDPFAAANAELFGPFPLRILVPLVVWLLPLPTALGFHLLAWTGLVLGAVAVTFLARAVGVGDLAFACPPAYVACFAGVYNVYQYRLVDTVTAGLASLAILAAYRQRRAVFSMAAAAATAAKELGITLPLVYYLARRGAGHRELRIVLETLALSVPAVLVFLTIRALIPHGTWDMLFHWRYGLTINGAFGYEKVLTRAVLENFGLLWILWPLGFLLAPGGWQRMHLYGLAIVPLLAGANWNRMPVYLLPFALPSALLVLQRRSERRAAIALAGSAYVAILVSLYNLSIRVDSGAGANLLLVPGFLVFALAGAPAARDALAEVTGRYSRRRAAPIKHP